jgi:hypothetical protein
MKDFTGVYIDIQGFEDDGEYMISELTSLLNVNPIISRDGRYFFFDIRGSN